MVHECLDQHLVELQPLFEEVAVGQVSQEKNASLQHALRVAQRPGAEAENDAAAHLRVVDEHLHGAALLPAHRPAQGQLVGGQQIAALGVVHAEVVRQVVQR